jgi:alkyl sulfatase BDS1-like metallo-beta-lactamase superfamily hydrolase
VQFGTATFRLTVDDGTIDIARGPAERPDLTIETDPQTLEELAFAGLTVRSAQRAGTLSFEGDRATLERLLGLFTTTGG